MFGKFGLPDSRGDGHVFYGNSLYLVGLTVDTDIGRDDFARFLVHQLHHTPHVSRLFQVLLVFGRKFMLHELLIKFGFLADGMGYDTDTAVRHFLE